MGALERKVDENCLFGIIYLIVLSDHEIFQFLRFWLELPWKIKLKTIFRIRSSEENALKNPEDKYGHNDTSHFFVLSTGRITCPFLFIHYWKIPGGCVSFLEGEPPSPAFASFSLFLWR